MTATMTQAEKDRTAVDEAMQIASANGFTVTADGEIVTVTKNFAPGDNRAYIAAESDAYSILSRFRMVNPGTVWGTDSGSVGGFAGLSGGYVRMNKSGVSKRQTAYARRQYGVTADRF